MRLPRCITVALLASVCTLCGAGSAAAQALKVVSFARTGAFDSLDPQRQFDPGSHELVTLVYSRLLQYAYLERPYKLEPDLLETMPALSIVPHEAVAFHQDRLATHPVGSGPFMLQNAERKGVLRFLKNPNFHGTFPRTGAPGDAEKGLLKDAGKKLPLVDVLEMPLIEEGQPAALKFLKGELDWRNLDRANFTKMIQRGPDGQFRLAGEFAARFNLFSVPGIDITYTGINLKDPLLGRNKALRQALAHLFDTQTQIDLLLGGRGHKLHSLVPLDFPGSERDTGSRFRDHDIAAARQLLAEAGYPGGKGLPPLTVSFRSASADTRDIFNLMKTQAAAGGVQLRPQFLDGPGFIRALEVGNFQLAVYGWVADHADAENFYQLAYSKNVTPGPNFTGFSNAAYDKAYETAKLMTNGPARYTQFKRMNDILRDEVPLILEVNPQRVGVAQKWLLNFKRNQMQVEFPYVDVDIALKQQGVQ